MNTKLLVLPIITFALVACPTTPPTPTIGVNTNVKVLATADVTAADPTQLEVSVPGLAAGDVVVSEFKDADDDGILRRVTSVTPASVPNPSGVGPQAITKVYVKTEAASLEDVFTTGEADIPFGGLDFGQVSTQTAQGVQVEAVTNDISLKNVTLPLPNGVGTATFNGSIKQSLEPTFKLTFNNGKVDQFEIGLSGTLAASLKAKISTTAKYTNLDLEKGIASTSIRRLFFIGGVPVIVVIEPKVVIGMTGGSDAKVTVEAGIEPTLSGAFKLAYNSKAASTKRWTSSWTPPSFSLNPSFSYTVPTGATGTAFAKLVMDVKFYGLFGPSLETKPFVGLNLKTDGTATTEAGLAASGTLKAGLSILGKSMEIATDPLTQKLSKSYTCSASSPTCK
jgi:hypothetical protein